MKPLKQRFEQPHDFSSFLLCQLKVEGGKLRVVERLRRDTAILHSLLYTPPLRLPGYDPTPRITALAASTSRDGRIIPKFPKER